MSKLRRFCVITLIFLIDNRNYGSTSSTTSSTTTTTTVAPRTAPDQLSSRQMLTNYRDIYYATEVLIGSQKEQLTLTVDTRTNAIVVAASDNKLSNFGGRNTFDSNRSSTFHVAAAADGWLSPNVTGTDTVQTRTAFQAQTFPLEIVLSEQGLNPRFKPFLEQPFDGIFYIYGYMTWTTMYLPKECSPDPTHSNAFISYGRVDNSHCSLVQEHEPAGAACVIPYITIYSINFGLDGGEEKSYSSDYLQGYVIPVPEVALPKAVFDSFTSDLNLTLVKNGTYVIDCKVNFEKRLVLQLAGSPSTSYTIPIAYLVDQLTQSECVLRMRPLDPASDNYCSTVCGKPRTCTETSVILGLPFLHRYCVSHDPGGRNVGLHNLLSVDGDEGHQSICDYSKFSPSTPRSTPFSSAQVPTWAIAVSVSFGLVVVMAIGGALFWWWKRRNKRRRKIIADMTKKYNSMRRSNVYVTPSSMRRDKWELLSSEVKVFFSNKIGSGAFADVYKGRLVEEKLEVAVKLAKDASDEARQDLQREVDFMKDLGSHIHVLSMVGHTTLDDDRLALVLEFCSNGDLSNWLIWHTRCINRPGIEKKECEIHGDRSITEKQLISFAWQVADGLVYLASRSLIHRDIAARNVLLTSDLTVKISDFGLCRRSEGNVYNTRYGKLPIRWMAPEALRTGKFTSKTDVWSYGVLLYEIYAAGSLPFPHVQPYEQLAVLDRGERPEQPEACPDNLYDLMRRCWQSEPNERATALELKQYLEVIIGSTSAAYGYFDFGDVADSVDDEAPVYI